MSPEPPTESGRIVAGFDGSPPSLEALTWAARQCELTHSTLEVVRVWQWPTSYGWAVPVPIDFDPEVDVRRSFEATLSSFRADYPGVDIEGSVVEGHPAPILVDASKGADLLVVGSRGHGEFIGMVIGSVSEYCATHAHCPVLIHRSIQRAVR